MRMWIGRLRTLASLCLIVFVFCSARASDIATGDDIQNSLATYVRAFPHAAVVAAVSDGKDTKVYTRSGAPLGQLVDQYSEFQIGSVTKTFTAALLAQMVLAGEVSLHDPISTYLPKGITAPNFDGKQITLLSLAEQNSGLPRLPTNLHPVNAANPYADYTTAQLYDFVEHYHLTRAPGAQYEYSNLGVTLLGQLLANREHTSYAKLLTMRVLRPLGMTQTTVAGNAATRTRLVPGYAVDGTSQPPWDFGRLGAAGSSESDLHDILIYLRANMNAPAGSSLGPAMTLAQKPLTPIGLGGVREIGLIWMTNTASGITWHNGETGGYHAFIGFDRALQHGVVVLANVADMKVDQIAVHILDSSFPAPHPLATASTEPSPYSGRYPLTPSFAISVFQVHGRLYGQRTGQQALGLGARFR